MTYTFSILAMLLAIFFASCMKAAIAGSDTPQNIILTTIDPSQPTNSWRNRFASFSDLLASYYNLVYSKPTLLVIKIPAGATVNVSQISFSEAQNLEALIQGDDRKASVIKFDSDGCLSTNNMNVTITNLSMTADPRELNPPFDAISMFSMGNASLEIIDVDIDFSELGSKLCSLEIFDPNYKIMRVLNSLLIRGVNGSFGGLLTLIERRNSTANILIEDSVFNLTVVSNYFIHIDESITELNSTLVISRTNFHVSNSCGMVEIDEVTADTLGLICLSTIKKANFSNIALYMEDNYSIRSFITVEDVKDEVVINSFDVKIYGANVSFYSVIKNSYFKAGGVSVLTISDVSFEGKLQQYNRLASEKDPSFFLDFPMIFSSEVQIQNIQAKNLIFNHTRLIRTKLKGSTRLEIHGVPVSDSFIATELIHVEYKSLQERCSTNQEDSTLTIPISGVKILHSQIAATDLSTKIISFSTDCQVPQMRKLFMHTLELSGWKFLNNTFITGTERLFFFERVALVSISGWYLLIKDLEVTSNNITGMSFFKIEGTQPVIRLSSATFQNNTMRGVTIVSKEPNIASFLCSLQLTNVTQVQKVPNFRYLMIENSTFRDSDIANSLIVYGDFANVFAVNNSFQNLSAFLTTLFSLRYSPCNEAAPDPFEFDYFAPYYVFFRDLPKFYLSKPPTIVFTQNIFINITIRETSIMNLDGFDYFKILNEYYSDVFVQSNKFTNLSDISHGERNLFNFWCGGSYIITNNEFKQAMVQGYIFSIKNDECDSRMASLIPEYGSFYFSGNIFDGSPTKEGNYTAKNQTGVLDLSLSNVENFFFRNNIIIYCQTLNRGLVNLALGKTQLSSNIMIEDNMFISNSFRVESPLQRNFMTIKCESYQRLKQKIYLTNNSFLLSSLEGDPNFMGSVFSLIPSFLDIQTPDSLVFINRMKFIRSQFGSYGFLGTIVAYVIKIDDSRFIGCGFKDSALPVDIKAEQEAKQGLFFLSSRYIYIENTILQTNLVRAGSYFFLDNYWSISSTGQNDTQEITFRLANVSFVRNTIYEGAIVRYSGGSFGVNLEINKVYLEGAMSGHNQFILIDDPKMIKVRITNSEFSLFYMAINLEDPESTLFSFKNLYFNSSDTETKMNTPIIVDNCTFQVSVSGERAIIPKFQITNANRSASNSWIVFSNCNFWTKIQMMYINLGGFQFELVGSKLLVENCTFTNLLIRHTNIFSISDSSTLRVINSTFNKSIFSNGTIIMSEDSDVVLDGVSVFQSEISNQAMALKALKQQSTATVNNSNFSGNILLTGAAFLYNPFILDNPKRLENAMVLLEIHGAVFEDNMLGTGATCVRNTERYFLIESSVFRKNNISQAGSGGAALNNGGLGNATVVNCTFDTNVAGRGGAIYSTELITIINSRFVNNFAYMEGGAIFLESTKEASGEANLSNNTFLGNMARNGNSVVGAPHYLKYRLLEVKFANGITLLPTEGQKGVPIIANFTPGANFSHNIRITAYDMYNNSLSEHSFQALFEATLGLSVVNQSFITEGILNPPYYVSSERWIAGELRINGSNLKLTAPLGEFVLISITTPVGGRELALNLLVQANATCERGQIFMSSSMICRNCTAGWYSRDPTETACLLCPTNAKCYDEEDQVSIDEGYWANMSNLEITPVKCVNNAKACKGGPNSECEQGYAGPACEDCAYFGVNGTGLFYTRSGHFKCNSCTSSTRSIVMFSLVLFATFVGGIIFIAINIYSNEKYVKQLARNHEDNNNPTGFYFRLLATYMQIIGIIQTFNFQLPEFITTVFSVANPSNSVLYSSQCLVIELMNTFQISKAISLPYFSTLFVFAILGAKLLLYTLIWAALKCHYRKKMKYRYLVVAIISIFFLEQPSLMNVLYGIISCKKIDEKSMLTHFPSFECSTSENKVFFYFISTPLMILITLILPISVLIILIRGRNKLRSREILLKYGTLISDYKPKYFYWAFVLMWFKFALISLSNMFPNTTEMDLKIKALGLILVFSLYLAAISNLRPYNSDQIYTMDKYLNYLNISTIFFTYMSLSSTNNVVTDIIYVVCLGVIVITNILFLTYSGKLIYQANVQKAKHVLNRVYNYIGRKTRRLKDSDAEDHVEGGESPSESSLSESSLNEGLLREGPESLSSSVITSVDQSFRDNISLQNMKKRKTMTYEEIKEPL